MFERLPDLPPDAMAKLFQDGSEITIKGVFEEHVQAAVTGLLTATCPVCDWRATIHQGDDGTMSLRVLHSGDGHLVKLVQGQPPNDTPLAGIEVEGLG